MSTTSAKKPNILIIVIDSLRADHVSCYGYHRQTTPSIDRLAAEGCLFETASTAAPFSPASYASIFSNLYPHQHGVNGDTVRIWPDSLPRLPEAMRNHGYFTFGVSNNDFVGEAACAAKGLDTFFDMSRTSWRVRQQRRILGVVRRKLGDRVADRLSTNRMQCTVKGNSEASVQAAKTLIARGDRPFFGFIVLMNPHMPYDNRRAVFLPSQSTLTGSSGDITTAGSPPSLWLAARRSCRSNSPWFSTATTPRSTTPISA